MFFLLLSLSVSAFNYGENYDKECSDDLCTISIYSYQRYYQEDNQWKEIDENFGTNNCESGYAYCVDGNLYQVQIPQEYGEPLITYESTKLSFDLVDLGGFTLSAPTVSIQDNVATYTDVVSGIDVHYTYLPHTMKEEIIVHDKSSLAQLQSDLEMHFSLNSYGTSITSTESITTIGDLYINDLVAYDDVGAVVNVPFSVSGSVLTMTVPLTWLNNESRVYPVTIDPTIDINVSAGVDGWVGKNAGLFPPEWNRRASLDRLDVGNTKTSGGARHQYRSWMEWDVSTVPDDAIIQDINLTLYVFRRGHERNRNITATFMQGNSSDFPNEIGGGGVEEDCLGNCLFWQHMATQFANATVTDPDGVAVLNATNLTMLFADDSNNYWEYFNLSNGTSVLKNATDGDDSNVHNPNTFTIGLYAQNDQTTLLEAGAVFSRRYASAERATANERPVLYITYNITGANETDGDDALEEGIVTSTPTATIHDEQQVYTVDSSGTQQVGTFDKFSIFDSQRWAFNYVTTGESFTSMNNISSTFFVLELEDLLFDDIVFQVGSFINGTKN